MKYQVVSLCGLLLATAAPVVAQHPEEMGLPIITNYGPRDYDAGGFNWGIAQDPRGIMFFGNDRGIMEFDGTEWRQYRFANESTGRSVAVGPDGTVYTGGVRELGYLAPDSSGRTVIVSLVDQIPEEHRDFTDVWHTYAVDDGAYFFTDRQIYHYSPAGMKVVAHGHNFHVGFRVGPDLYIREWGVGILKLEDDELNLVPGGDRFADERVYVMLPYDDERAIVVTRSLGLFLFDGESFEPFETEVDEWLAEHLIYLPGTRLEDGGYALPSISGGVAIMNRDGTIRQIIDQTAGIPDNGVVYTLQDQAGDLWLGLSDGISRLGIGSPYSIFDERSGFASRLTDVDRFKGDLFAASQSGFYRFDRETRRFSQVPGTSNQIFDLEPFGDRMLVGAGLEGLYEYRNGTLKSLKRVVDNSFSVGNVHQSEMDSSRVFLGLLGGIGSMRLGPDGEWIDEGTLPDYDWTRFWFIEKQGNVLWASGPDGPPARVTYQIVDGGIDWADAEVVSYGGDKGGADTGSGIFELGGEIYSVSEDEHWIRYDEASDSFIRAPELDEIGIGDLGGGFAVGPTGRYWVSAGSGIALVDVNPDGSLSIDAHRFDALTDFRPGQMLPEKNGITWIVAVDGLIRYDEKADHLTEGTVAALIRGVTVGGDSLIYTGSTEAAAPEIPFNRNSIRFGYSSTNYRNVELNRFQTRLVGFEDDFTDWVADTRRDFTNLNPGQYEFQVRTQTAAGLESDVASYSFAILPPWYRTWWAYTLFGLALAGMVVGFVGWRTRQLKTRQAELERIVDERTAEINQRVEELAVINSVQEGLVAEMDIQGIYDLVGERIRNLFDAQVVVIRTFDWEKDLEIWNYAIEKGERLHVDPRPIGSFFRQVKETVVRNVGFAEYMRQHSGTVPAGEAPKSAVFVPLTVGDQIRGNVSLQNVDRENAFSESDVRLLTTLANSMSVALENARLFDQTTHLLEEADLRAEELSTVNRISKALVAQLEFDTLVELVGEQIQALFKADMAYVALYDEDSGMINFPYGYGDDFPALEFGEGLTSQIIQTGQPLLIHEDVSGSFQEMGIEEVGRSSASYLGVPIPVGSEVIGVISVQSESQTGRFDDDDQRLLSTIAANVGVALQNAEAYRKLNKTLSDLKNTQEQLVTQEKMASLGQLAAGIAHEIKNPLNFVNNFAELISELAKEAGDIFDRNKSRIPDDVTDELIPMMSGLAVNAQQIHKHGKRADAIVKNMMDHATGGSGERYRVEVNPMVEEYMQLAYHGMRAQNPNLEVDMRKAFDTSVGTVDMSPREIGRVIVNLVNNALYAVHERAIKENDAYRPAVTVGTARQNGSVVITVQDNGSGIPDSVREKVFEPLFTTKPTGSGTGLGLSLSFDIVTQTHGGKLEFQSAAGVGTTFTVTLPARG